MTNNIGQENI